MSGVNKAITLQEKERRGKEALAMIVGCLIVDIPVPELTKMNFRDADLLDLPASMKPALQMMRGAVDLNDVHLRKLMLRPLANMLVGLMAEYGIQY